MVLGGLSPRDVARMTGLEAFDAFDAYLITGGLPLVALEWEARMTRDDFLGESLSRSTSALVVSGARVLDSEFPEWTLARSVLSAIGARGERTFTGIHRAVAGGRMSPSMLTTSLQALLAKRVVAADEPLSTRRASKDRRWRIADPSLRFWLAFVEPALNEVDRGQPELAMDRVRRGYESWRGRAIEPVVRSALERLLPDPQWPSTGQVGGWWPRSNSPEIDMVGTDARPAQEVTFVGTIKWRNSATLGGADIDALASAARAVPGVDDRTPLVAVSGRRRTTSSRLRQCWTAQDLIHAWP